MGLLTHLGRPANEVVYEEFEYNSKKYIVGNVVSKGETYKFIIDGEDYEELYEIYPYLDAKNREDEIKNLTDSYTAIIALSN